MTSTLASRKESRAWQKRFNALAPKPRDIAPDFELWDVSGESSVHLSDFRGHEPVALIFGSFT